MAQKPGYLRVHGSDVVDGDGKRVILKGVCIGTAMFTSKDR